MGIPGVRSRYERTMPRRLIHERDGQNMVEYALLAAIVALGAVAALSGFQNVISNVWAAISNNMAGGS